MIVRINGFDIEMESPQEPTDEAIETENEIESNEADAEEELIDDQEAFEDMIRDFENEMANDIEIGVEKDETTLFTRYTCRFLTIWQYTFGITDCALKSLITFLFVLITTVISCVPGLEYVIGNFPSSLYKFQKLLNQKAETKFVK